MSLRRNRIGGRLQTIKSHAEVAIAASERTLDIVSVDEVFSFGMPTPECSEVCGTEIVRGPFALDGQRFLSPGSKNKVPLLPAAFSPVKNFSCVGAGSDVLQHRTH